MSGAERKDVPGLAMWKFLVHLILFRALKLVELFLMACAAVYYLQKPKKCPAIQDDILLCPAVVLAEKIRKREVASESVIRSYISRIKAVNPILNAVVEDRFDQAIEDARRVDQLILRSSPEELASKYPLLGLPLTVKESIALEGLSHAAGKVFPEKKTATRDAEIVKLCKDAGAIPLLVSATPELCAYFECINKVTGRTNNPYDTRRTPGGSSGGEGALLAAGASLLGLGSDICGSIRLPAHYCGIWGHKPSAKIVSTDGHYPNSIYLEEWDNIFTLGPMCRYSMDLPLLLNVILKEHVKESLQINKEVDLSNIKLFYTEDWGCILENKTDRDIFDRTKQFLSHMCSTYDCKSQKLQMEEVLQHPELCYLKFATLEEVEDIFDRSLEQSIREFFMYLVGYKKSIFSVIFFNVGRHIVKLLPKSVVYNYTVCLNDAKENLIKKLGKNGILLCPSHPAATPIHGLGFARIFDYSLLGIFNCLGFPVTNSPLGLNSQGLPIGIQVVAAPGNDNLSLAVAREIEKVFGGWVPPSCA